MRCDPTALSLDELERLTRRYTYEISPLLGPDRDVPAPDVNTDGRVMAWLMDTLSMTQGQHQPGSVTGKPLSIGGTRAHAGATSSGCLVCARAAFARARPPDGRADGSSSRASARWAARWPSSCTRPACGWWRWPTSAARSPTRAASTPVALSDHVAVTGSVAGFTGGEPISAEAIWDIECELLVPAALGGAIDEAVARRIQAQGDRRGGQRPHHRSTAQAVLDERGIVVVPDILANAGGVTASYFEWAQSRQGYPWDEGIVAERLRDPDGRAFVTVWARAEQPRRRPPPRRLRRRPRAHRRRHRGPRPVPVGRPRRQARP